jgi:hypothetical protein
MWKIWWNFAIVQFFAWMGALQKLLLMHQISNRIGFLLVICTMLVASLCNKYKTDYGIACSHGFLWGYMFFLILGSGRLELIIYSIEKLNYENQQPYLTLLLLLH